MKSLTALALLLLCAGAARAAPVTALTYGFGAVESCGSWTMGPSQNDLAETWINGYWSGLNSMNNYNHQVGAATDDLGMIGEVQLACQANPSEKLISAVFAVYLKMTAEHHLVTHVYKCRYFAIAL